MDSKRSSKRRRQYDALALTTMASGNLCLNLSENVSWESFPAYADALLERVGGTTVARMDAVDIRIWDVVIGGATMHLVFDDFPWMVSLESRDGRGDDVLRQVHAQLAGDS